MEDDIPRDGGILPEYAATLFIGIDEMAADGASGQIWSFCYQVPISFVSFGNFLLTLDQILDELGTPERWLELRSLQPNTAPHAVSVQRSVCYDHRFSKLLWENWDSGNLHLYEAQRLYARNLMLFKREKNAN